MSIGLQLIQARTEFLKFGADERIAIIESNNVTLADDLKNEKKALLKLATETELVLEQVVDANDLLSRAEHSIHEARYEIRTDNKELQRQIERLTDLGTDRLSDALAGRIGDARNQLAKLAARTPPRLSVIQAEEGRDCRLPNLSLTDSSRLDVRVLGRPELNCEPVHDTKWRVTATGEAKILHQFRRFR